MARTLLYNTNEQLGLYQSFAKFFSKLGGVYDFPFREISREIRVVIWLLLPRNSSLGWEELGKSNVRAPYGTLTDTESVEKNEIQTPWMAILSRN